MILLCGLAPLCVRRILYFPTPLTLISYQHELDALKGPSAAIHP